MSELSDVSAREETYRAYRRAVDPLPVRRDVDLAPFTTFRIGGPADLFVEPDDPESLLRAVRAARRMEIPHFLLGCGANILFGDGGFRGVVIHNTADAVEPEHARGRIRAESGAIVYPDLIDTAIELGLSGLEHYVGIPSTVGGALWQNLHFLAPPPERERTMFIEEVLAEARILTEEDEVRTVGVDHFEFGYDDSILHHRDDVVLEATFQLRPGDPDRMRTIKEANLEWRADRHPPLDDEPSAGSIFQKIEGVGAGRLIDDCGLKGTQIGGALVTHRHANILINAGGATAADVIRLIEHVREVVARETGYELQPEISFVGEFGDVSVPS